MKSKKAVESRMTTFPFDPGHALLLKKLGKSHRVDGWDV